MTIRPNNAARDGFVPHCPHLRCRRARACRAPARVRCAGIGGFRRGLPARLLAAAERLAARLGEGKG